MSDPIDPLSDERLSQMDADIRLSQMCAIEAYAIGKWSERMNALERCADHAEELFAEVSRLRERQRAMVQAVEEVRRLVHAEVGSSPELDLLDDVLGCVRSAGGGVDEGRGEGEGRAEA